MSTKPSTEHTSQPSVSPAFAAASVALLLWSGTAIANKVAVAHMDALTAGVLRSMLAGILALVIALVARLPFPRSNRDRGILAISGLSSFGLWPLFLSIGIARTTASHAALVMAILPLFTVLIGAIVLRRRPHGGWWIGALVAFTGTAMLIANQGLSGDAIAKSSSVSGDIIVVAGCILCSIGYVAGATLSPKIGTAATTFWGLAIALIITLPTFAAISTRTQWSEVPTEGWLAIAWMTLLSSLAGYALWFFALGRGGIGRIGSLQLAQPVLTLAGAAVILGENVTLLLSATCATILFGTYLAQRNAP